MEGDAGSDEWLDSLKALAEELNSIPSGIALHGELARLLEEWQSSRAEVDNTYNILLSFFLGTLLDKGISTDVVQLTAQMIQARAPVPGFNHAVTPPLRNSNSTAQGESSPRPATAAAEEYLATIIQALRHSIKAGHLTNFAVSSPEPSAEMSPDRRSTPSPETPPSHQAKPNYPPADESPGESRPAEKVEEDAFQETIPEPTVVTQPKAEQRVNSAYRMHLDRKHGQIEKLQEVLSKKAIEAISQNKEFGALLETERAALQQASSVTEIALLKEILIGSTDELIDGQRELADKLKSSFEYLQLVKSDSKRLHEELHKVRLLSLTDEFTGLPNRRAFMRRLEDEISRVERYDIPLTLALIDLDNFKEVNDKYGHPAGDAVLSWYASNALPTFRHYDMVARYGGEEFAVLFPNTAYLGALKALKKMRRRIEFAECESDGTTIKVPTFSAGLTVYQEGDTQASLIKRADEALYMAKNRGRNRIEMILSKHAMGENTSEVDR